MPLNPNKQATQAVLYLRVSSEEQVNNFSLSTQEEICSKEAEKRSLTITQIFREEGRSAKTISGRPQLLEMMDYCRKNKRDIECVIVYRLDRISRQVADYLSIRSQLAGYGVNVLSATEPTGSTPTEKLIETILAGFAQLDNDVRSERTKNGQLARFKSGLLNAKAPLGYISKDGYVTKDPDTFEIIKLAWEKVATGTLSLRDVAAWLNDQGIGVIKGGRRFPVRSQTVSNIFHNKFYYGILVSPQYGLEVKGQHVPMISEEMYYQVQAIIDGRGPNRNELVVKRMVDNPKFPLRRHLICSVCGCYMTGAESKGRPQKYAYYFCRNRCGSPSSIPTHSMEERMVYLLDEIKPTPEGVQAFTTQLRDKYKKMVGLSHRQRFDVEELIKGLKEKRQSLIEKNLEGTYPDDIFREQLAILDDKLAEAHSQLNNKLASNYDLEGLIKFVQDKLANLPQTYANGTELQRKALLGSICPSGFKWMYPGLSNRDFSPYYQQIRGIAESYAPYGDA